MCNTYLELVFFANGEAFESVITDCEPIPVPFVHADTIHLLLEPTHPEGA